MSAYPYPPIEQARTIFPFVPLPDEFNQINLERAAWHEAGHAVVAEWLGYQPTFVSITESSGRTFMPPAPVLERVPCEVIECVERNDGSALAAAAALYHAGIMSEWLRTGTPWAGIVVRANSTDWVRACDVFERHHWPPGAGHGHAQRLALWILSSRWDRVAAIAEHLIEHRGWIPGDGVAAVRLHGGYT